MRRKAGPVQQWVDSIPSPTKQATGKRVELEENPTPPLTPVSSKDNIFVKPTMTVSSPIAVPGSPIITMTGVSSPIVHNRLARDPSFQSDSSHCSSVESLLELRRADPEAILLGLGFGGCPNNSQENGPLSRIPKRFLQPSKLQGIAINDFVKHQQETSESLDSASLGYRGLTGSPYVAPSEIVQKIMERLREHESHDQDAYTVHNNNTEPYSPIFQDTSRLSVLSPDNRQFLERPRSKSPDMRNKRMIIGQKSFAFGCDGDWIEINPMSCRESHNSSTNGNSDNHEIKLVDKIVTGESMPIINNNDKACTENPTKSTVSNVREDNRLSKETSIDNSVQDLNSQESNSLPDKLYLRSCDDSVPTRTEISQRYRDSGKRWREGPELSDDDHTLSPRRGSYDSCDMKRMTFGRFSRDNERRHSDGYARKTSLLERRKSLRRQPKINDDEAVQYCKIESRNDDLSMPEMTEKSQWSQEAEERAGISIQTKLEVNETDREIHRSDRLSESSAEKELEFSRKKLSNVEMEINGNASAITEEIQDSTMKKREKKRKGLSVILGMYNSAMSVKMEPGF